ncbi:hypothetical protein PFNF54_03914, partial [Plasmodium falciparum NF54]
MCTMLARSFADIGDIIRGRDLYSGNKVKKKKLDDSLKTIFGKIYEGLTGGVKERYTNDGGDFFQLREDWWTANRETVWKAMTCSEHLKNSAYFRVTCSDKQGESIANHKCRCPMTSDGKPNDQVPTYFDYVPQYLRWFEEWAEDFCRKKKIYVGIVKKYCLDETEEKYCSLNGCDCTQTVRAKGKLRYGNRCTDCLFACHRYEKWIDNQRKQFLKQRNKYADEIKKYINEASSSSGSGRQRRGARNENYDGYESKFYDILKNKRYENVDAFLGLLNNEKACQAVTDDKGGRINFKNVNSGKNSGGGESGDRGKGASSTSDTSGTNDETKGTFYRSKYCQPCPICGMKKKGGKWEAKNDDKCKRGKLYEPTSSAKPTEIKILKSGENHDDIEKKLEAFCETQNRSDGSSSVHVGGGSGGGG